MVNNHWLVVSNMNFIFHNIWDIILPIDFHIFSRWLKPPTISWQNNGHWIGWRENFHRKHVFFLWNMGFSCRFSLKEIQWNGGFRFVMGVAKMHPVLMDEHEFVLKQPWWLGVVPYFSRWNISVVSCEPFPTPEMHVPVDTASCDT